MEHKWKFRSRDYYLDMIFDDVEEVKGDKETLTGWLNTDIIGYQKTLEYIDDVLSGKNEEDFLWGNAYKAYVKKDFTEIHFIFEEDNHAIGPCTVPTKLLREIVKAWLDEHEKFCASKREEK